MALSFTDWAEIDLPTIIILIVMWLLDHFGLKRVEKDVNEIKTKVSR